MPNSADLASRDRLNGIEATRGFAALAIVIFHLVWIAQVKLPSTIDVLKYFLGFGVPLFFVISAFSLGYGYLGRLDRGEGIVPFYIRRLFRIGPLFYFMLVVQMLLAKFVYGVTYPLRDLLLNLTFLFNFSPRLVDGIVPASWSIGIEMIFYFILPGFLILARHYVGALIALILSITAAAEWSASSLAVKELNPSFAAHGFLLGMPYFCFGLLALHLYRSLERTKLPFDHRVVAYGIYFICPFAIAFLMFNGTVLGAFTEQGVNIVQSSLWGLPFGLLCVAIALHPIWILVNRLTLFWGRVSYSLYLTHPGIIFFFHRMGVYEEINRVCGGVPTFSFLVSATLTITVVSAISWVTFSMIEVPGMALGRRLVQSRRRPEAVRISSTPSPQMKAGSVSAPITGA